MADIQQVIVEQALPLMAKFPGVITGVGQSEVDGKACILVMLEQDLPEVKEAIPGALGGYPVIFQVTGPIQAERLDPPTASG